MVEALNIPPRIVTPTRNVFTSVEAFSLLCARFRTAGEMYSLVMQYDRAQSALSEVIN
jgi:nuclease HARBI1